MQQNDQAIGMVEDEIRLLDFLNFLTDNWKKISGIAIAGAVLGWGGWFALTPYKGELVINVEKLGSIEKPGNIKSSIDYMTWRNLEQNLPLLARQMLESGKFKEEKARADFTVLSNKDWWQQNVVPTYALTKADTKSLLSISKELQDSEANTILNIIVSEKQHSPEAVERKLNLAADFIQQGAAYLAIKSLTNRYLSEIDATSIQQQITQNEVELMYQKERARRLEALRAKFPQSKAISTQQVLEINDANAKYMPLESQLIAVYSEINKTEVMVTRLRRALVQQELRQQFLTAAAPLIAEEKNGLQLLRQLVDIESKLRGKLKQSDQELILAMESIRADLMLIGARYGNGLTKTPLTRPAKSGPLLPVFGGFIGGGFLMLIWLVLRQSWAGYRAAR